MQVLKLYPNSVNQRFIDQAVEVMREGGVILYPTDTVYALGCDALNKRAVAKLCAIKGLNPDKNMLSIMCSNFSQASEYVKIDNKAFSLLKAYLPGPYTFVLPVGTRLPKVFRGRRTVGVRISDNPIASALAESLGNPMLTASVDADADDPSLVTQPESLALRYAPQVDLVLDGGSGDTEPSTVVDLSDPSSPELLRRGKGEWDD